MTEAEWLASADPAALLDFHRGSNPLRAECPAPPPSDRQLRLFACACCRQVWDRLTDERSRRAVEVAERYADGEATQAELAVAKHDGNNARFGLLAEYRAAADEAAQCCTADALYAAEYPIRDPNACQPAAQAALARCIFGSPWRPVPASLLECPDCAGKYRQPGAACLGSPLARWRRTPAIIALARACYDGRDWAALPVLADVLEESGCPDAALLGHLRGPGPHARGCWALDLLLAKE